jgi:RNA-directed DNA polymerase
MNSFDYFIKHDLGLRFYGRYVDDSIFVHESEDDLQSLIPKISSFSQENLRLTLHPKKISLALFFGREVFRCSDKTLPHLY